MHLEEDEHHQCNDGLVEHHRQTLDYVCISCSLNITISEKIYLTMQLKVLNLLYIQWIRPFILKEVV